MTESKPKRRWSGFRVWTLIVIVTMVGVSAGWIVSQRNFVRERQEFLTELKAHNGSTLNRLKLDVLDYETAQKLPLYQNWPPRSVSFIRHFFGDRAYLLVVLPEEANQDMVQKANDLFPEAELRQSTESDKLVDIKRK